ncbi:alpha-2,3-sialyltransferase [Campylobacter canadensis]|uniref:alpha-2,3-sialyltransferase n=1 Tax=Campylobacter canadensis TaxID=449520 RepID=UPI001CC97E14|nr:alpha-2,3-sialyltransferase [Campylobacter canadensis]MBZ8002644.1 hypothetical protein [Campylobacter canadensis]
MSKNVIIAGNGPSLKNINYKRLPKEYDVFRCNQFYFEEKYYLGKNIKAAFFNPGIFLEQYYTLSEIKKTYKIENIFCSSYKVPYIDNYRILDIFNDYFCDVVLAHNFINKLKSFKQLINYNEIFFNKRITSSVYMCAVAIALGYKNIYLCGVDFYEGDEKYAFNSITNSIKSFFPNIDKDFSPGNFHSKEYDLEILSFLAKEYKVNIFSLCDNSVLKEYFPLANENESNFTLVSKENSQDLILPEKTPAINKYKSILNSYVKDNNDNIKFNEILENSRKILDLNKEEIKDNKEQINKLQIKQEELKNEILKIKNENITLQNTIKNQEQTILNKDKIIKSQEDKLKLILKEKEDLELYIKDNEKFITIGKLVEKNPYSYIFKYKKYINNGGGMSKKRRINERNKNTKYNHKRRKSTLSRA